MTQLREARAWWRRRWVRGALAAAVLLVGGPEVCTAVWRFQHPAPLGRTPAAVEASLDRRLPPGAPLDSAEALLRAAGLEYSVLNAAVAKRRAEPLAAGGPLIIALARDVDVDFCMNKHVQVRLAFDTAGRLVGREAHREVTAC